MVATKIYGHRGCMGTYPENTLLGFEKAIEQGVDGIELDVQMTKDGEIVVIHDEMLDRTTDGTGYITDLTLEEVKRYSAGVNYSNFQFYNEVVWAKETVPTLHEVLEFLTPYDVELNIELKTYLIEYEGIEEKVVSLVNQYGNNRKVIFSSFHLPSLLRIKRIDPTAKIAWLLHQIISQPHDYLETFTLDAIHLSKDILLSNVYQFKELSRNLRVWMVNDIDEIKQLIDLNVDSIITDFPERALFYRSERASFV
ncbi:glycerophosphodiester phosphodiesterase [Oceanobacillus halophilus]|uniref:Glycerophosphodiester phosphodiesterase n=1 Tax=Oceanobacillus halophilus TaxID=930130 RepID=A0A495A2F1_9BACI|nr:glycerophosphodiester phosphodiesterase [Oceanobacillus halophilus]RKQ33536.1 glycerophosphodiester phosphodiesterase [Oceanobacillus halophilus]